MPIPKLLNPPPITSCKFDPRSAENEGEKRELYAAAFLGEKAGTLERAHVAAEMRVAYMESNLDALVSERLASAKSASSEIVAEKDGELMKARTRIAELESQLADKRDENLTLATVTRERDEALSELATERGKLTTAERNVSLLEGLCGVSGVDPANAVPLGARPVVSCTDADYEARMRAARTPFERDAITKEFQEQAAQGRNKK